MDNKKVLGFICKTADFEGARFIDNRMIVVNDKVLVYNSGFEVEQALSRLGRHIQKPEINALVLSSDFKEERTRFGFTQALSNIGLSKREVEVILPCEEILPLTDALLERSIGIREALEEGEKLFFSCKLSQYSCGVKFSNDFDPFATIVFLNFYDGLCYAIEEYGIDTGVNVLIACVLSACVGTNLLDAICGVMGKENWVRYGREVLKKLFDIIKPNYQKS